jgi:hypothetical protein
MSKNYVSALSVQAAEARERIAAEKVRLAEEEAAAAEEAASAKSGLNFIKEAAAAAQAKQEQENRRRAMAGPAFRNAAANSAYEIARKGYGLNTTVAPPPKEEMTPAEIAAPPSASFAGRFASYPVNKRRLSGGGRRRTHAKAKGHRKSQRHTRRRAVRRTRKH